MDDSLNYKKLPEIVDERYISCVTPVYSLASNEDTSEIDNYSKKFINSEDIVEKIEIIKVITNIIQYKNIFVSEVILKSIVGLLCSDSVEASNASCDFFCEYLRFIPNNNANCVEETILAFIIQYFRSDNAMDLLIEYLKRFQKSRPVFFKAGILNLIHDMINDPEDITDLDTICKICRSLLIDRLDLDEYVLKIVLIFDEIMLLFDNSSDEGSVYISSSVVTYLYSHDRFVQSFYKDRYLFKFLYYHSENPKYIENVLQMCSILARFSEEYCDSLISNHIIEFLDHYLISDESNNSGLATYVLAELLFYKPELCHDYLVRNIPSRVVSLFNQESTTIFFKKAALRLSTFLICYSSSLIFDIFESIGVYNIVFENAPLCNEYDLFFVLRAILRAYQEGYTVQKTISDGDKNLNSDLINWIEGISPKSNSKMELLINSLLSLLKN